MKHIILKDLYNQKVKHKTIKYDYFQELALVGLQHIINNINKKPFFFLKYQTIQGMYIWGGIGRGKTWVMDFFFDLLPTNKKYRIHFHNFMQEIQDKLANNNHLKDPIKTIVQDIAKSTRILCIDEFIVEDIADAMILSRLLEEIFKQKIILVVTSNQPPDKLYQHGLQRERFIPAINLIKTHLDSVFFNHEEDFRTKTKLQTTNLKLENFYSTLRGESQLIKIKLGYKDIKIIKAAPPVLWIKFANICNVPLGKDDYRKLSQKFKYVLLDEVPMLDDHQNDQVKRFIKMVDLFYDQQDLILISDDTELDSIYTGKILAAEFKRTHSRLHEMRATYNKTL